MVTERVIKQLSVFAFSSAAIYARNDGLESEELELIEALADSYGDAGWFAGNQAVIVYAALTTLGVKVE
jgi:hypothetical protein